MEKHWVIPCPHLDSQWLADYLTSKILGSHIWSDGYRLHIKGSVFTIARVKKLLKKTPYFFTLEFKLVA